MKMTPISTAGRPWTLPGENRSSTVFFGDHRCGQRKLRGANFCNSTVVALLHY
jgi:hypothetical protein